MDYNIYICVTYGQCTDFKVLGFEVEGLTIRFRVTSIEHVGLPRLWGGGGGHS